MWRVGLKSQSVYYYQGPDAIDHISVVCWQGGPPQVSLFTLDRRAWQAQAALCRDGDEIDFPAEFDWQIGPLRMRRAGNTLHLTQQRHVPAGAPAVIARACLEGALIGMLLRGLG
jgi:hypothetical protein